MKARDAGLPLTNRHSLKNTRRDVRFLQSPFAPRADGQATLFLRSGSNCAKALLRFAEWAVPTAFILGLGRDFECCRSLAPASTVPLPRAV